MTIEVVKQGLNNRENGNLESIRRIFLNVWRYVSRKLYSRGQHETSVLLECQEGGRK